MEPLSFLFGKIRRETTMTMGVCEGLMDWFLGSAQDSAWRHCAGPDSVGHLPLYSVPGSAEPCGRHRGWGELLNHSGVWEAAGRQEVLLEPFQQQGEPRIHCGLLGTWPASQGAAGSGPSLSPEGTWVWTSSLTRKTFWLGRSDARTYTRDVLVFFSPGMFWCSFLEQSCQTVKWVMIAISFFLYFFFAVPHSMWDFSNQGDQGWNPCPLDWQHGILAAGPPGKLGHFL